MTGEQAVRRRQNQMSQRLKYSESSAIHLISVSLSFPLTLVLPLSHPTRTNLCELGFPCPWRARARHKVRHKGKSTRAQAERHREVSKKEASGALVGRASCRRRLSRLDMRLSGL